MLLAALACAARVAFSPVVDPLGVGVILPYVLLVFAPAGSLVLALRWFAGDDGKQPQKRFARFGNWRTVGRSSRPVVTVSTVRAGSWFD